MANLTALVNVVSHPVPDIHPALGPIARELAEQFRHDAFAAEAAELEWYRDRAGAGTMLFTDRAALLKELTILVCCERTRTDVDEFGVCVLLPQKRLIRWLWLAVIVMAAAMVGLAIWSQTHVRRVPVFLVPIPTEPQTMPSGAPDREVM